MSSINNKKLNNKKNILGDRLKVKVSTGEKSPVHADTPTKKSHQSRTCSGKICAVTIPASSSTRATASPSNHAYKKAGMDYASFTKLHTIVHTIITE